MIRDLILANRSYRRFDQSRPVDRQTLVELVELGTLSPSAANLQPLRYMISCDSATNAAVFPHLAWAGYLTDWEGPAEGERPTAYVIILNDTEVSRSVDCDHGIAAQSLLLGAVERGLGGCMIGSIKRDALRDVLHIPKRYEILLVIALGYPAEKVVVDAMGPDGDIRYYRDAHGVHHVPKRSVDDVVIG